MKETKEEMQSEQQSAVDIKSQHDTLTSLAGPDEWRNVNSTGGNLIKPSRFNHLDGWVTCENSTLVFLHVSSDKLGFSVSHGRCSRLIGSVLCSPRR